MSSALQSKRRTRAQNAAISRHCGCDCGGCAENKTNHCLTPPCRRIKNRRTKAETDAAGRYPNGRIRQAGANPNAARRRSSQPRTPEQIAAAGRYPSGRPRPDRTNWTHSERNDTRPDPLIPVVEWFVHAVRNGTALVLPAPAGRDEAYAMAGNLFMVGWTVGVIEP